MTDFEARVRGDGFDAFARDLRAASKDIKREGYRGLRQAAKPMIDAGKANASRLPRSGGLAKRVAGASFTTRITGGRDAGVRIVGRDKSGRSVDLAAANAGRIRHKTFGHAPWMSQDVPDGFWDDAVDDHLDTVRRELLTAIDRATERIRRG